MPWGTITATILTLAAAGAGIAEAATDSRAPITPGCFDAPAEGQMQPFSRPGWSRAGSGMGGGGRVIDEPRWWPTPLIAPFEWFTPAMISLEPGQTANCFAPGSNPTREEAQTLEWAMRGGGAIMPRYFTDLPWPTRTVTWSLVPDGTTTSLAFGPDAPSTLFATMDSEFTARAQWIGLIESCLARWSQVTGIEFVRVRFNGQEWDDGVPWNTGSGAPGLRGDIRIGARFLDAVAGGTPLAVAMFPVNTAGNFSAEGGNLVFGDQWVDGNDYTWGDSSDGYRTFRNVFMHEIGHAIGMRHVCPAENTKLMEQTLSLDFSGPQHDDIRGVQSLYGDIYEPNDSAAAATDHGAIAGNSNRIIGGMPGNPNFTAVANSAVTSITPNTDQDWHRFFLTVNTTASVTVTPVGATYANGDCDSLNNPSINTRAQQRLIVSIVAANGTTVLGAATAPAVGQSVVVSNVSVPAGFFYVRMQSASTGTQTQMYLMGVATGTPGRPPNDDCANAQPIGLGVTEGNNGGAFLDGPSTLCGASAFSDVWYSYTPTCDGRLDIRTCTSALDTVIGVQSACGGAAIVCNDNGAGVCTGGLGSALTLGVSRGQTYLIRVAGRTSFQNSFILTLALEQPRNVACATAELLDNGNFDVPGSTCGSSGVGNDDPVFFICGNTTPPTLLANPVWYRYTPSCTGELTVDTCDSDFDSGIHLLTGACGGTFTQVACSNDVSPACSPNPRGARLKAQVTAGTPYFIRVAGINGATGRFRLRGGIGQANDTCDGATSITPGTYSVSLCNARREGFPACAPTSVAPDVFFRYVPSTSGVMTLDTCGSPAGTVLELLTGTCGTPVGVACNNDQGATTCPAGPTTARIDYTVTAGTPYLIRLAGSGGPSSTYTLRLNQAPANDLCVNATTITSGTHTGTTVGAGREANPACAPTGTAPDVWYRWVAPCEGDAVFDTCGSSFDTVLTVYTGANCSTLTEVGCNDNSFANFCGGGGSGSMIQSYLRLAAAEGTTYWIRVAGAAGTFNLRVGTTVANDTCATAAAATVGSVFFDTRCATPNGSATCIASSASPDLWYRYVGSCNAAVWMSTCASNYDTVLSVSTGACTGLTQIACNDDQGSTLCPGNFRSSRVVFRGTTGTTYLVRVGGVLTASGTGNLEIRCCPADFNLNGVLSVQDIFDFLAGYFAGLPAADFNNSGTISVQDIFDFLAAYFAGCP